MRKTAIEKSKARVTRNAAAGLCLGAAICALPVNGVELPALDAQDTIVVTADQAWESDDGEVLNFKGNFELTAPDYFLRSDTAEIHGSVQSPSRILASGSPVTFWIRDVKRDERIHGQGQRVDYNREGNLLRLVGEAVLQDDNTVMRSSLLEYDTETRRLVSTGTDGVEIVTQPNRD